MSRIEEYFTDADAALLSLFFLRAEKLAGIERDSLLFDSKAIEGISITDGDETLRIEHADDGSTQIYHSKTNSHGDCFQTTIRRPFTDAVPIWRKDTRNGIRTGKITSFRIITYLAAILDFKP